MHPIPSSTPLAATAAAVDALGSCAADFTELDDATLVDAQTTVVSLRRECDKRSALLAAEIARRSSRDLGAAGLAARNGFASPEAMLQNISGTSRGEATRLVTVGTMMAEAEAIHVAQDAGLEIFGHDDNGTPLPVETPWYEPVTVAVTAGVISLEAGDAIRRGLGVVSDVVPAEALHSAADTLVELARSRAPIDRIWREAHLLRDALDAAGIADREAAAYDKRSLRITRHTDGSIDAHFHAPAEDAIPVMQALDRATSSRTGGPRFTDPEQQAEAEALRTDPRTLEQIRYDSFIATHKAGLSADPSKMPKLPAPAVKIIVVDTDHVSDSLENFSFESGQIEGTPTSVSRATIDRLICATGARHFLVDSNGDVLDRGREIRTFSKEQRDALALRDGGCMDPDCNKPPSQTEAHHPKQWIRDLGPTNVDNGILLCFFHHMTYHRLGFEVLRDEHGRFWLQPPKHVDPNQALVYMPSNTAAIRELATA
jgi:hypothetical protein